MKTVPPCVLTIAGSDSGGGAGIQADARTIRARGGFACTAITAITAQNTHGVLGWWPESADVIAAQITAVLEGRSSNAEAEAKGTSRLKRAGGALPIQAAKTGLLPGAAAIGAVARALAGRQDLPLVVDPVIGSTSGTVFLDATGVRALRRELLPRATLVTPNWPEAEALTGMLVRTFAEAERAARYLVDDSRCAVLVKGGHAPGSVCRDCLVTRDGAVHWFESIRVATPNTHGTGCVLSAAIAVELAKGCATEKAVKIARDFLQRSLRAHRRARWGGAGPAFW